MTTYTDYTGFIFNGKTSEELGITRVSDGSRYNEQLLSQLKDTTVDPEGMDGVLFFNTFYKTRTITLNVAFDTLTETQLRQLRQTFNGRQPAELIFYERPYKVYNAKVTGTSEIKFIPFDERLVSTGSSYTLPANDPIRKALGALEGDNGVRAEKVMAQNPVRIYKGEGTITLSAFTPFAHTPQNGKFLDGAAYSSYPNISEWAESSGLLETQGIYDIYANGVIPVYNPGDEPAPFKLYFTIDSTAETVITLGYEGNANPEYVLTLNAPTGAQLLLDSKQGLIYQKVSGVYSKVVNNYITGGTALFKIKPCTVEDEYQFTLTNVTTATITYDYLYH